MNPRVKAIEIIELHRLLVTFENHEQRMFDASPLFELPVFKHLENSPDFYNVRVAHGTITWANELDICPDTVYLDSTPV
jgi:hypothetical protein